MMKPMMTMMKTLNMVEKDKKFVNGQLKNVDHFYFKVINIMVPIRKQYEYDLYYWDSPKPIASSEVVNVDKLTIDKLKKTVSQLESELKAFSYNPSFMLRVSSFLPNNSVVFSEQTNEILVQNIYRFIWEFPFKMNFSEKLKFCIDAAKTFGWQEVKKSLDSSAKKFLDEQDLKHCQTFRNEA